MTQDERTVHVRQTRTGRFCVFRGALQIAAIEAAPEGPHIERYGDQVFAPSELRALAQVVLAAGEKLPPGATLSLQLEAGQWQTAR